MLAHFQYGQPGCALLFALVVVKLQLRLQFLQRPGSVGAAYGFVVGVRARLVGERERRVLRGEGDSERECALVVWCLCLRRCERERERERELSDEDVEGLRERWCLLLPILYVELERGLREWGVGKVGRQLQLPFLHKAVGVLGLF